MLNTRVAGRYAKSLIDLSIEQNMLDKVYEDMLYLKRLLKDREFVLMLKSPIVTSDKKADRFKCIDQRAYLRSHC